PDQPRLGDTFITTSMLVAFLMGVTGVVMYLVRTGKLQLSIAEGWSDEYWVKKVEKKPASSRARTVVADPIPAAAEPELEEPAVKRKAPSRAKPAAKKATGKKAATTKSPAKRKKSSE
ncbi:MAG: hypothetical protein RIR73_577, partial [Chloroflexota bacterium]